ncbi:tetratricopeptide repeat protein [Chitinibacteraceae bacterium HSL-7]
MNIRYVIYPLIILALAAALSANNSHAWHKVKAYYGGYANLREASPDKLIELAEAGNSDAQRELAYRYEDGNGVPLDEAKALHWQERAAIASGAADDQARVGWMYEMGVGTEADPYLAASWYRRAVAQGNSHAQNLLALLLLEGKGAKVDVEEGCRLLEQSAKQGLPEAESNLAFRLGRNGLCGSDVPRSLALLEKAAIAGNGEAAGELGRILIEGEDVPRDVETGMKWMETSHRRGVTVATGYLGWLYLNGHEDIPQDLVRAEPLLRQAAGKNNPRALTGLGWMYEHGNGVATDLQQAESLYRKAAIEGYPDAQFHLGKLLAAAETGDRLSGHAWMILAWTRQHGAAKDWLIHNLHDRDSAMEAIELARTWKRGQDLPR